MNIEKICFQKILSVIKNTARVFRIIFYLFGISVPIYAIKMGIGFLPVHISLICVSSVSLVLYIIYNRTDGNEKKERLKAKRKTAKSIRRYIKKYSKIHNLITLAYAVYFTASEFNILSLILLIVIISAIVLDILLSVLIWYIKRKIRPIKEAVKEGYRSLKEYK